MPYTQYLHPGNQLWHHRSRRIPLEKALSRKHTDGHLLLTDNCQVQIIVTDLQLPDLKVDLRDIQSLDSGQHQQQQSSAFSLCRTLYSLCPTFFASSATKSRPGCLALRSCRSAHRTSFPRPTKISEPRVAINRFGDTPEVGSEGVEGVNVEGVLNRSYPVEGLPSQESCSSTTLAIAYFSVRLVVRQVLVGRNWTASAVEMVAGKLCRGLVVGKVLRRGDACVGFLVPNLTNLSSSPSSLFLRQPHIFTVMAPLSRKINTVQNLDAPSSYFEKREVRIVLPLLEFFFVLTQHVQQLTHSSPHRPNACVPVTLPPRVTIR